MKNRWLSELCEKRPPWLPEAISETDSLIAVSSRIRLARNLSQWHFPNRLNAAGLNEVLERVISVLSPRQGRNGEWNVLPMSDFDETERELLFERRLISRDMCSEVTGRAVAVHRELPVSIMINEEDHLRIQVLLPGNDLENAWCSCRNIERKLAGKLSFAITRRLGALTACPTNVGTGLRASVMLHLPAMNLLGYLEGVNNALLRLGFAMRGTFGEGTEATGSLVQVSNQYTLGETEEMIISRLVSTVKDLCEYEHQARRRLKCRDIQKLCDQVGRAYGTLRHARMLSSTEALNCWSLLWLGIEAKLFSRLDKATLLDLFTGLQPGHLQHRLAVAVSSPERDRIRADMFREALARVESRR